MQMMMMFSDPAPGQLTDGECFAQPFYRLWEGDNQSPRDGIFDGVGPSPLDAFNDAVQTIEREMLAHGGDPHDASDPAALMSAAYDLADAYERRTLSARRQPSVCRLTFYLTDNN